MEQVEYLGVTGILGPLRAGWGASVEMIGSVDILTLLSLSLVAGGVTLTIGVTGNIEFPFNWLKESEEHAQNFPSKFHGCASACSSEMRRLRPRFDHCPGSSQYGIVWKSHPI